MYSYPILYFYFLDLQTRLSFIPLSQAQGDIFRNPIVVVSYQKYMSKSFICLFIYIRVWCKMQWWRFHAHTVNSMKGGSPSGRHCACSDFLHIFSCEGWRSHCAELTVSSGSFYNFIFNSRLSRYVGCSDMCVKGFIWCAKILILNIVLWAIFLKVYNQKL